MFDIIIADRLKEQMEVLTWIFPYPDEKKVHPMEKTLGVKFKDLIPIIVESLSQDMIDNPETTEMYLDWLSSFALYVTGQIDEPPPIECEPLEKP